MRRLLLAIVTSLALQGYAQADVSLDGIWQLTVGDKNYTVTVPHTYNTMDGLEDYAGEAIYQRALPDIKTATASHALSLCRRCIQGNVMTSRCHT